MHIAFSKGNIELVMYLHKAGASLNTLNRNFHTPLAYDTNGICKKLNLLQGMVTQKRSAKNLYKMRGLKRSIKTKTDNNKLMTFKTKNLIPYNDEFLGYQNNDLRHHPSFGRVKSKNIISFHKPKINTKESSLKVKRRLNAIVSKEKGK